MYSHLILCNENGNQYKPCEIDGVPLTIEILEGCKELIYSDVKPNWFYQNRVAIKVHVKDLGYGFTTWLFLDGEWHYVKVIRFVHELQNFYALHAESELNVEHVRNKPKSTDIA